MRAAMTLVATLGSLPACSAFVVQTPIISIAQSSVRPASRSLLTMMAQDFKARAARKPGPTDRVIELEKPLGIVLEEDEKGNVYVKELSPAGNAKRCGKINQGDLVTMISATFGDEMWSARGAGLSMIMQAIKIRQGKKVKIAVEAPKGLGKPKPPPVFQQREAKPTKPQKSEKELLDQLEAEEKGRKKLFGLF